MKLQIVLNTPKNHYLNQATPKNYLPNFPTQKNLGIDHFNPPPPPKKKKKFNHPRQLKCGVTPPGSSINTIQK